MIGVAFYVWLHGITSSIGFITNIFLIFLAVTKSPPGMKVYSIMVINFGVSDLMTCAMDFITKDRLIPSKDALIIISHGTCVHGGPRWCWVSHAVLIASISHSMFSLALSFIYRYKIVRGLEPSRNRVLATVFLLFLPSMIGAICFYRSYDDPLVLYSIARNLSKEYIYEQSVITGISEFISLSSTVALNMLFLPLIPVNIIVFVMHKKIKLFLLSVKGNMSKETVAIHNQLLTALAWQSFLPIVHIAGICFWLLGITKLVRSTGLEFLTMILPHFVPVMSPIIYIYYITPYRSYTLSLIRCKPCCKKTVISDLPIVINGFHSSKVMT